MSTTFWAVFLGVLLAYLVTTLIEGIVEEIQNRREARFWEAIDDEVADIYCNCD